MKLFWEKGYRATTPNELVQATGLSKSSLYNTFGSKEGLFVQAIERYIAVTEASWRTILSGDDLRVELPALVRTLFAAPAHPCLIATTNLGVGPDDLLAGVFANQGQQRLRAVLTERIRRGQLEGEVQRRYPAEDLARLVLSHVMGIQVLARGGAEPDSLVAATEILLDAIVD